MANIGMNDLCPCGTGKKYKKCCLDKDRLSAAVAGSEGKLPAGTRVIERDGERYAVSEGVNDDQLAIASEFFERKRRGHGPAQQIADFAKPLLDGAKDADSLQKGMTLGMVFWNLAITKDEKLREEMLEGVVKIYRQTEESTREFRVLATQMVERHRQMFPDMHR